MRKLLVFFLSIGAIVVGCGDPAPTEEEEVPEAVTIIEGEIDQTLFAEPPTTSGGGDNGGGTEPVTEVAKAEVKFEAPAPWTSTIGEGTRAASDWVKMIPASGPAGANDVVIEVQPNYSGADRDATITILCGTGRSKISIKQKAVTQAGSVPIAPLSPNGGVDNLSDGGKKEV